MKILIFRIVTVLHFLIIYIKIPIKDGVASLKFVVKYSQFPVFHEYRPTMKNGPP